MAIVVEGFAFEKPPEFRVQEMTIGLTTGMPDGAPSGKGELRQYFVLRVDKGRVCTATLTSPMSALNETTAVSMMKCLSSIRPA